jgi:DMSO reductase family type II enzyme heme b subunit
LDGAAKPYFLFGDPRHPTEIWFQDLARESGERFIGKGNGNLATDGAFRTWSGYADGEWWVIFQRPRRDAGRLALEPGAFVPVAFSVWDGFRSETGSSRGVTSWYNLYLKPAATGGPLAPASKTAAGILLCEALAVWYLRRRLRAKA